MFEVYTVYTTSNGKKGVTMNVTLAGKDLDMQLDTEDAVSLVSEMCYHDALNHLPLRTTQ